MEISLQDAMIDLGQLVKCVIPDGGLIEFSFSSCVKIVRFITEIKSVNLGTGTGTLLNKRSN